MIVTPQCYGMAELPAASKERAHLNEYLEVHTGVDLDYDALSPAAKHVALGLALTVGSALGQKPPTCAECLAAFVAPNKVGLTAGARAWSKHAYRSGNDMDTDSNSVSASWWGGPRGPIATVNAGALGIFEKIVQSASWRNLHWLPHMVLVYEVRVADGYGMRWSQDQSPASQMQQWIFRGFVEPMMENGHELGWRH